MTKKLATSKDVLIDEKGSWDWHTDPDNSPDHIPITLEDCQPEEDADQEREPAVVITNQRPQRNRAPPARLNDYHIVSNSRVSEEGELVHLAFLADAEPIDLDEALSSDVWKHAMREELKAIEKNATWELVNLPMKKKPIVVKWVFKVKHKPDGTIAKHKVRLVAKGFLQKEGLDYSEVIAPVARLETVRLVIALANSKSWKLFQLDVKSAFLNGPLEEEVYVLQPPGFVLRGSEEKVFKLKKALYGLKQAPRAWNKRIDSFLLQLGFVKCSVEHGIYISGKNEGELLLICLYVDDLLITGSVPKQIEDLKRKLKSEFEMTDLGELTYFLGLEFVRTETGIVLHQRKYISEVLKRFNMSDCNLASIPIETGCNLVMNEVEQDTDGTLFK